MMTTLHQDDDPETSDELDDVMEQLSVPQEEISDWLSENDPGYCEYTDEEIVTHVKEVEEQSSEDEDESP